MHDDVPDVEGVNRYFLPPRLLRKRPSKAKLRLIRRRKRIRRIRRLVSLFLMVVTIAALSVNFTDIGGTLFLTLAKNYLATKMNLTLDTGRITGNPIKGYTIRNIDISQEDGSSVIASERMNVRVSFASLIQGRIRMRDVFFDGAEIDSLNMLAVLRSMDESPELPFNRLTFRESRIDSPLGAVDIARMDADTRTLDVTIAGSMNGLPLSGTIDAGESAGLTAMNRADINAGSGKITAVGGMFSDIMDIHATLQDMSLREIAAMYPDVLSSRDFDGTADVNFDVTGVKENPKVFGSISIKGRKVYGFPVERMSATYDYSLDERRLSLSNIQASMLNVPVQGELAMSKKPGEELSVMIKLEGSESGLDGLDEVLDVPELKLLRGRLESLSANVSGYMNALNGLVSLSAPRVTFNNRTFSNVRAQLKLSGSDKAVVDGKFDFEGAQGFIQGSVESVLRDSSLDVTMKIADLDVRRVANMIPDSPGYKLEGKLTVSLNLRGRANDPEVTGTISSSEFSGWSQRIMNPAINFSVRERVLTLDRTEGTIDGKPITITGTLSPFPSSNPELSIDAHTESSGVRIRGTLNDPSITSGDEVSVSQDVIMDTLLESRDASRDASPDVSADVNISNDKGGVSGDENIAD